MKIQIKPVSRTFDSVKINLSIEPQNKRVLAICHLSEFLESQVIEISGEDYDNWGTDDNYIYDLVLTRLGYKRA